MSSSTRLLRLKDRRRARRSSPLGRPRRLRLEPLEARQLLAVDAGNTAPLAADQSMTTDEDTLASIVLSATDLEGDLLSYAIVGQPGRGFLSGSGASLTYHPATNWHGTDSFTFKANDGLLDSNVATVTITVNPVNDAPGALDGQVTADEDTRKWIVLTAWDVDNDPAKYLIVTPPEHGTLTGTGPSVWYTPTANYFGPDSFTFKVNDGQLDSNVATIWINVRPANDLPVAADDAYATDEDQLLSMAAPGVFGNDVLLDAEPLTAVLVSGPSHGTLDLRADGSFDYTPAAEWSGTDRFLYKAREGQDDSNVAAVTITVAWVNDVPAAQDQAASTDEDTAIEVVLAASDVEGDPVSYLVVSQPAHGTLSGTAPNLVYTPAPDFHGLDVFTFAASDGQAAGNVATVSITVRPVNDPPVLADAAFSIPEGSAKGTLVGTVAGSDVDADALAYAIVDGNSGGAFAIDPTSGQITVAGGASLDYERASQYVLTVQATDPGNLSAQAVVTIRLTDVNETLPVAIDIRPGNRTNTINLRSPSRVEVAILSTATFDARQVLLGSLRFGRTGSEDSMSRTGRGQPRFRIADVNRDRRPDLVVQFETKRMGFQPGDTEGVLTGRTSSGAAFQGRDKIALVVPGKPRTSVQLAALDYLFSLVLSKKKAPWGS